MKYIYIIFFVYSVLPSFAQVSGQVLDSERAPIKNAVIVNFRNNSGCISDSLGFFSVNASPMDSIRIQHLGFQADTFVIHQNFDTFMLNQKIYDLKEVIVSRDYAVSLYFVSYKNLIAKLQKESRNRCYCNAVMLSNKDTIQIRYLDLDFEQKITRNTTEPLIHNRFFEIQNNDLRRKLQPKSFIDLPIRLEIFPKLDFPRLLHTQNKEEGMNDKYVFQTISDSNFIKIKFIPKQSAPASYKAYEATVSKKDTCLVAFAVTSLPTSNFNWKNKNSKPDQMDHSTYFKMLKEKGFYYVSEIYSRVNLYYSKNDRIDKVEYTAHLKNYFHAEENLRKRLGIPCIDNGIIFKNDKKSKYSIAFWEDVAFPREIPYNFVQLRGNKHQFTDQ